MSETPLNIIAGNVIGTARLDERDEFVDRPSIRTDGRCVEETLAALERGDRGKPMDRSVLEVLRSQSADVLASIVEAYSTEVARGEVGSDGSGRASSAYPRGGKCPTGLLYGRVQSGKTAAMIVTGALAIDNGFRIIVALTSNNVKLVKQTAERFADLDGALIASSLDGSGGRYAWDRDRNNIVRFMSERGAVFVCAKEDGHLQALIEFLQSIGAADFPALILDDEADHATPDTRVRRRSR
ncbi:MAG: Endonuclease, partial [Gemmatimonadetes bacterium]|nr:Endonuclease [Gemmatimonadota bacterium]